MKFIKLTIYPLLILSMLVPTIPVQTVSAANPSWSSTYANWVYRKPVPVAGSASWGSAQTNYQVPVNPSVEEVFDKTGLVGDWNFDEGGGTVASDKSGNNNHGTMNGSSYWTSAGKFNSGFSGDGSGNYVSIPDSDSWAFGTKDFSIGLWVNFADLAAHRALIGQYQDASNFFQIYRNTDGNLYFQAVDGIWKANYNFAWTPSLNTWYYFEAVRTGSTLNMYVNGVSQTLTVTTAIGSNSIANLNAPLYIGRVQSTLYAKGSIDETKIWNRALTADEIYKHYVGYANNSLVGSWHFSEGSGTAAADSSGQGNNGTITGATYTTDKYGTATKALSFNGSSNKVTIADSNSLDLTNSLTIESWIKKNVNGQYMAIVSKRTNAEATTGYGFNSNIENTISFVLYGKVEIFSTGTITDTSWHHVSVTYDGINVKFYIDGITAGTTAETRSAAVGTNPIAIGMLNADTTLYPFSGTIDEPKIYNRALTASEIAERYRNSSKIRDDYGDLRFTSATGTALDYWQETDAKVWVEADSIPNTAAGTTLYQYYGNPSQTSASNGTNTFIQYHGNATAEFHDSNVATGPGIASRHSVTIASSTPQNVVFGVGENLFSGTVNNLLSMQYYSAGSAKYAYSKASGTSSSYSVAGLPTTGVPHIWETKYLSGNAKYLIDGVEYGAGITTNLPTVALGLAYFQAEGAGSTHNWAFVRKYISPEPTIGTTGAEQADITDYTYKKNITFNTSTVAAITTNQNNFPIAVHINNASFGGDLSNFFSGNSTGKRIMFFDADETTNLPYEVEYSDGSSEAIYWVKVPQVDASSATDKIVVAYGRDAYGADQDNPKKVWDSSFKMVQHLGDNSWGTAPEAKDSTYNGNNGTNTGSNITDGQVRKGRNFTNSGSSYISVNDADTLDFGAGSYVISYWRSLNGISTTISKGGHGDVSNSWYIDEYAGAIDTKVDYGGLQHSDAWVNVPSDSSLNQISVVRNISDSTEKVYVNGALAYTWTGITVRNITDSQLLWIGKSSNRFNMNGNLDEIRLTSGLARSADWIKLEYYSMKKTNYNGDNDGTNKFITFGTQGPSVNPPISATLKGFFRFLGGVTFK